MPTPFMHLDAAARSLAGLARLGVVPASLPAFYLGHIAPDVTTVSGKPRSSTHFFSPRDPASRARVPHEEMLSQHPALLRPTDPRQQSFVMGVIGHLKADELWMRRVAVRFFGGVPAEERRVRRLIHDTFRARWDMDALEKLPPEVSGSLEEACSRSWYPLEEDRLLHLWRDRLLEQTKSGRSLANEVFSSRLGMSEEEFAAYVQDEAWQAAHVAPLCGREDLRLYWEEADAAMVRVMAEYASTSAL